MPSLRFVSKFHQVAKASPAAPALVWQGETRTYGELLDLVRPAREKVAALGDQGPICVPGGKSPDVIALLIACWEKERPVLLPSDKNAPAAIDDLAARAGCDHIAAVSRAGEFLAWRKPPAECAVPTGGLSFPADMLLMLTTSGSTSSPKVVLTSSSGIDAFIDWARDRFRLSGNTVALNYAPLNFDICLLDVWATLAVGGCVVLVEAAEAVSAESLSRLISVHGVTLTQAVPFFFRTLADAAAGPFQTVRDVLITGEAAGSATVRALPTLFPAAAVTNVYGCTETNDSFIHTATSEELAKGDVLPIGRPLPGVQVRLVTRDGGVVDGAAQGRLLVSSPYQVHGYLEAALTQTQFLPDPDPDCHDEGGSMPSPTRPFFDSGDIASRDEDGVYWFEGRNDHQVKVRGVGISTTSVEDALRSCPGVEDVAVIAVPDDIDGHALHAVIEAAPSSGRTRLTSLVLRRVCVECLPAAVMPASFTIVEVPLPRTSTGKIDRKSVEDAVLRNEKAVTSHAKWPSSSC